MLTASNTIASNSLKCLNACLNACLSALLLLVAISSTQAAVAQSGDGSSLAGTPYNGMPFAGSPSRFEASPSSTVSRLQGATTSNQVSSQPWDDVIVVGVNTASPGRFRQRTPTAEQLCIMGAALTSAGLLAFLQMRKKKAAMWSLGASAAAILVISGFAWGIFGTI